ncbi:phosphoserine transaminase [Synchytrium endobioticum]|uniref:phosphoserine transaminase n=1 Tax=Synchytrium endobioticum TaxID=286115 RepID=A0A507CL27_9FUNG|nr:phosphoserine transaminase [Synchytrium endobioticum]TPX43131.1 phosphoserine transaminase [Synchytrium endobioticum]
MTKRLATYNFSAGPAVLPLQVLQSAQAELLDYADSGMSVMELSHRSPQFEAINDGAQAALRSLWNIPSNYHILFMQGGATAQFSAIVYNLAKTGKADYLVTGAWGEKAVDEAKRLKCDVGVVLNTKNTSHNGALPPPSDWNFSPDASYIWYCSNETIHGVELGQDIIHHFPPGVPVVCDMSSNALSRPVDVSKYAVIFAGAQKNIGPAGVTIVVVRHNLLGKSYFPASPCPVTLDYKVCADSKSLYNTPPTYPIYMVGLVLDHMLQQGGLDYYDELNNTKAKKVYDAIHASNGTFVCPVAPNHRSRMNIPFRIHINGKPSPEAEQNFLTAAENQGMVQLRGHRSVGGIRASLYNALPMAAVDALVSYMNQFAARHQ